MGNKICVIAVSAPDYRKSIYQNIDKSFDCEWFLGITNSGVKTFDISILKKAKKYEYRYLPFNLYWKKNILSLLFNGDFKTYLLGAESRALSDYIFVALQKLFFPKKRMFIWTHGWYGKETRFERVLKLWMFKRVDGIFLYGDYAKKILIEEGISPSKLFVIKNSLDYNKQLILRHRCVNTNIYKSHFQNDYPNLIFIGRLTAVKRLDMLINAVADLKEMGLNYNLTFIGDGKERNSLEELVIARNLEKQVWFYGTSYDEDINAELIYNADLCVAPGNIGLTAIHVLMFGCPAITHDDYKWQMPEFEAIQRGVTGDFFERDSVSALVDSIKKWFDNHKDNRQEVREACCSEIDSYWNPSYQLEIIKQAFDKVNYVE